MAFETRLAAASLVPTELRQPENRYHYVSIADADKVTPHFDWTAFFKAQDADVTSGFSLSQPKFFAEFDKMLGELAVADWQAYLRFHAIDNAAPYLSTPFQQEDFAFNAQTLNGQKEMKSRWKRTLDAVEGGMGMALGELYVARNFSPESKQRAQELVTNLRASYKTRIEKLEWMSDATKQKALRNGPRSCRRSATPTSGATGAASRSARRLLRQRTGRREVQLRLQGGARSASRWTAPNGA